MTVRPHRLRGIALLLIMLLAPALFAADTASAPTSFTLIHGMSTKERDCLQLDDRWSTTYAYDAMDRVQARTDPIGNVESYQYDMNGNLSQHIDRRGVVTNYGYDALNRNTFVGYGQSSSGYESTVSKTLDAVGRLTNVVDSTSGSIGRNYDLFDHLASETSVAGSVAYTYDLAGHRQTMVVSGQTAVSYNYDQNGQLTQLAQGPSNVTFQYDATGHRAATTLPNGVTVNYSYDAASQLAGIAYSAGQGTLGNLSYSYDVNGRRIAVGGSFARTGLPASVSVASYNQNNQLVQWGSTTRTYDANGNALSDGRNSYSWDARNHLVSLNGGGVTFQYDALGRRSSKVASGTATSYLYDGANITQESNSTAGVVNLLTGGLDEYFTRADSQGTTSFLADGLGSTVALADGTGVLQTQYTYDAYGSVVTVGSDSQNELQYTGRESDGTGLYYYRARYYDPTAGRFISEDPFGFAAGINFYSYVLNDPFDLADPLGLCDKKPEDRLDCANRVAKESSIGGNMVSDIVEGMQKALQLIDNPSSDGVGNLGGEITLNKLKDVIQEKGAQGLMELVGSSQYGAAGARLGRSIFKKILPWKDAADIAVWLGAYYYSCGDLE